jgi:hypothetical protein
MEFFIIIAAPPRAVRLDGSYGSVYSWEVLDRFFSVKCISEINMTSVLWLKINVFSFSVCCIRLLAFHKASCRKLAIT